MRLPPTRDPPAHANLVVPACKRPCRLPPTDTKLLLSYHTLTVVPTCAFPLYCCSCQQEAMGESLDDALDFDGVDFEADELTNQVGLQRWDEQPTRVGDSGTLFTEK